MRWTCRTTQRLGLLDSARNGSSVVVVRCAWLRYEINSTRLIVSGEVKLRERNVGGQNQQKVIKIRRKRFEKYHVPDRSNLWSKDAMSS